MSMNRRQAMAVIGAGGGLAYVGDAVADPPAPPALRVAAVIPELYALDGKLALAPTLRKAGYGFRFVVVVENVSPAPVYFWAEGNSEGHGTLSFEVTGADGSKAAALAVCPNQDAHVDMADLRVALDLLPPEQREALILVGAAGFSYDDAAEISGCAVGTIKSRVNRARCKLVDLLGVTGAGDYRPDRAMEAIVNRRVGSRLVTQR
jgi:predicted DNA-binding protein (UPF0251 family)